MSAFALEDRFSIRGFHTTFQWMVIKDINICLGQTSQGRTQLSIITAVQTMNLQYMFEKEKTFFHASVGTLVVL